MRSPCPVLLHFVPVLGMAVFMKILIANSKGQAKDSFLSKDILNELYSLGEVYENPYERERLKS